MKQVSKLFKDNIKKFGKEIDSIITYTIGGTSHTLGKPDLNGVTPSYQGSILKSVMKQLVVDSNVEIPVGTVINYKFGVKTNKYIPTTDTIFTDYKEYYQINNTRRIYEKMTEGTDYNAGDTINDLIFEFQEYEYVDYGNYIVKEIETKEDTNSYELTCYDYMLNSMKDYQAFVTEYPITVRNYLIALANYLQIEFANATSEFVNYNKTIEKELYLKEDGGSLGYTFRDVLDELAQVTASTICINNQNQLEIRYINEPSTTTSSNILDTSEYDYGSYTGTQATGYQFRPQKTTVLFYDYIEYDSNYNYIISANTILANPLGICMVYYDEYKNILKAVTSSSSRLNWMNLKTNSTPVETKYVRIGFRGSTTLYKNDIDGYELMLEKKVTTGRGTYEAYQTPAPEIDSRSLKDVNVKFGEKYGPINSIVLSRAGDSDSVYLQDQESITQNGLCEVKISENQIMNGNDRDEYLPGILTKLDGLEYHLNDYSSTGIAYLDLCDRYNIKIDNNTYNCIMINDELEVTQGVQENVETEMPKETKTDYTKADKTDRKINQTYIIVDKQQGQIESLASAVTTVEDELGNVYTKEEVTQLIQDAKTGWTFIYGNNGGTNLFRNTGLWFETDDDNNPYEFWTGVVARQSEERALNQNALLLQNTTVYQEQTVPNGKYTVSFKYKKIHPLATCSVIINDRSYTLTEESETEFYTGEQDADGNYITEPLIVSNGSIKVQFVSNMDGACEIYDLMVNTGETKSAYEQNQNETTTDTVNISKGITITSSDTYTTFKANSDGIRTLDTMGNELAVFTDKGMTTKEMVVQDQGKIAGTLIQQVGDQTWFTKI